MFHKNRIWQITEAADAATLARKLTSCSWTLCTAFRLGGYLFLNDSLSEDGAQEYCVVKESTGKTVESITMSWCDIETAETYIREAISGDYDDVPWGAVDSLESRIEEATVHEKCWACA